MKKLACFVFLVIMLLTEPCISSKKIRRTHSGRRLSQNKRQPRKLFGGTAAIEEAQQQTRDMHIMQALGQTSNEVSDIMNNVTLFQKRMDELAETVNTHLVQISSIANNNHHRNIYIGKI